MASRHMLFRVLYRLGFTPWDGHPLAKGLRDLAEGNGTTPLPPATALDLGCGTGDNSIYLAQHGWQVTGVDFVPKIVRSRIESGRHSVQIVRETADDREIAGDRGGRK